MASPRGPAYAPSCARHGGAAVRMALQLVQQLGARLGPFAAAQAVHHGVADGAVAAQRVAADHAVLLRSQALDGALAGEVEADRKSTRLNSSHSQISYAVFCLKKKKT